jgi:hypothetical protein
MAVPGFLMVCEWIIAKTHREANGRCFLPGKKSGLELGTGNSHL